MRNPPAAHTTATASRWLGVSAPLVFFGPAHHDWLQTHLYYPLGQKEKMISAISHFRKTSLEISSL
jgi:hypothetical protein